MLKAILYYILLIAEFVVTLIIGGLAVGFYIAAAMNTNYYKTHQDAIEQAANPIVIIFTVLAGLIVWLTFSHYKFSKFSLGKVQPAAKWMAMLHFTLPILGFTLTFYGMSHLFHINFMPKEMTQMNFLTILPFAIVGSFLSAYVFYGAIQEELIRSGKKLWVQMLTLCIMMIPACMMVAVDGDFSVHFTILGMITTLYSCWAYSKTRSTIVLFVAYLIPNLVPSSLTPTPVSIAFLIIGIPLTLYGSVSLLKKMPQLLLTENDHEDE